MKNKTKKIKSYNIKKLILPVFIFLTVLGTSLSIFLVNKENRKLEIYTEVTFLNPTQALVFWKTDSDTLGHVKYGEKKYSKKEVALQTSSDPGTVHVVFLDNIPLEGLYIKKINDNDGLLIIPQIQHIKYDSNQDSNE